MSPQKLSPLESFMKIRPEFDYVPGLALGATDSAHEVFFGTDGDYTVGVKAFVDSESKGSSSKLSPMDRAEHEKEMLDVVRKLGFYTLKPLRILETGRGDMAFLLTQYEPNLTTMSTVVQNSTIPESSRVKKLKSTSKTLAELHILGISHGDSQIKNFGIAPAHPGIMVFDFEKGGTDEMGHVKTAPFLHDLESLVQSLAHKSYGGEHTGVANEIIFEQVIEPYISIAKQKFKDEAEAIGFKALDTHHGKHQDLHSIGCKKSWHA